MLDAREFQRRFVACVATGKDSIRLRRKVAAWDDDFLASLIAA
jgi:hypothetical protein